MENGLNLNELTDQIKQALNTGLNDIDVNLELEKQKLDILVKENQAKTQVLIKNQLDADFTEKSAKKSRIVKEIATVKGDILKVLDLIKRYQALNNQLEIIDIELITTLDRAVKSGISISKHKLNKLNQDLNNGIH